jgi:hypothetical protein
MLNMLQKALLENLKCVEVQSQKLQRETYKERERERRRIGSPLEDDESTHHRGD